MLSFQERLAAVGHTLQALLEKPFPAEPAEPNERCTWGYFQEWLADAPDRLVGYIGSDYHDADSSGNSLTEAHDELWARYHAHYEKAIAAAAGVFGGARTLSGHTDYREKTKAEFETDLIDDFRRCEVTYWRRGDRVALVHLASGLGDGDAQVALSVMVVNRKAA